MLEMNKNRHISPNSAQVRLLILLRGFSNTGNRLSVELDEKNFSGYLDLYTTKSIFLPKHPLPELFTGNRFPAPKNPKTLYFPLQDSTENMLYLFKKLTPPSSF
jgi:hypothetical protein